MTTLSKFSLINEIKNDTTITSVPVATATTNYTTVGVPGADALEVDNISLLENIFKIVRSKISETI